MSVQNPGLAEKIRSGVSEKTGEPSFYKVLLHNDDYTTMDFVVEVLIVVFNKTFEEAEQIMFNVHRAGVGVCGVYPYEVAETKVTMVTSLAKKNGFPLKSSMEKE